jgi:hypothetical protein
VLALPVGEAVAALLAALLLWRFLALGAGLLLAAALLLVLLADALLLVHLATLLVLLLALLLVLLLAHVSISMKSNVRLLPVVDTQQAAYRRPSREGDRGDARR